MEKKGIKNMTPEQIAQKAIAKMNKKITNEIFLIIQNDKKLMYKYLKAVENNGLDTVNQQIGKKIKESYKLDDDGRENKPTCTLIHKLSEI